MGGLPSQVGACRCWACRCLGAHILAFAVGFAFVVRLAKASDQIFAHLAYGLGANAVVAGPQWYAQLVALGITLFVCQGDSLR